MAEDWAVQYLLLFLERETGQAFFMVTGLQTGKEKIERIEEWKF